MGVGENSYDNLDNPRGLIFGPEDALYITEAGRGGDGPRIPGPTPDVELSYGATGAISRIDDGIQDQVITGLPSLIEVDVATNEVQPTTALGPHSIGFGEDGEAFVLIGYGGSAEFRDDLGKVGNDFSRLYQYEDIENPEEVEKRFDFAAYELANNLDGADLVSNPFSRIMENGDSVVIDAGANTLLSLSESRTAVTAQTVFPTRLVENPFQPGQIPMQSVPTSVTVGPDGAYYVGELTGFPFPEDQARVYRIEEIGEEPTVYAEGFTQILDLDFDDAGNLYVVEYAQNSLLEGNPQGALIQVAPDGTRTTLSGGELLFPTDVEVGPDGNVYVAASDLALGDGKVFQYSPTGDATTGFTLQDNNIVLVGSPDQEVPLEFTLTRNEAGFVNQVGAVVVEDDQGTLSTNGSTLTPGEEGYTQAALSQGKTIFSTLPDGFDDISNVRNLTFEPGQQLLFCLIPDNTAENILAGDRDTEVFFASQTFNADNFGHLQLPDFSRDQFTLAWEDLPGGGDEDFNDVVLSVAPAAEPVPTASGLQDQEGLLDLRNVDLDQDGTADTQVTTEFAANSEAQFDNVVGWYVVEDVQGSITDPLTGDSLLPGDAGYAEAAIRQNILAFDANSASSITLDTGDILAPFLIADGTVDQFLNTNPANAAGLDPLAYFAYVGANPDGADHIRTIGDNAFGFEDLFGGGDADFNDVALQVNFV